LAEEMLKSTPSRAFLAGTMLGTTVWLLSPLVTGRSEPWDAEGVYYIGSLLAAGALGGFVWPEHWRTVAAGVFAGQLLVLLTGVVMSPEDGGLWPLGVIFLAGYSFLALLGGVLASRIRRRTLGP
jgi:hypothetical protein